MRRFYRDNKWWLAATLVLALACGAAKDYRKRQGTEENRASGLFVLQRGFR
jgi:hypothetical protein